MALASISRTTKKNALKFIAFVFSYALLGSYPLKNENIQEIDLPKDLIIPEFLLKVLILMHSPYYSHIELFPVIF